MAFAVLAKRGAGEQGYAGFLEDVIGQRFDGTAEGLDVGKGVEGAARHVAAHAGDVVEAGDEPVAAAAKDVAHGVGLVLRAEDGSQSGVLGKGGGAADRVYEQMAHPFGEGGGHDAIAEPPAGHGIGFGKAVDDDRALEHAGQGGDGRDVAVVAEAGIDFVGHDPAVARAGRPGDVFERLHGEDAAGGVGGRVEDDQARARAEQGVKGVEVEVKARGRVEGDGDGGGAGDADGGAVGGKAGVGIDDLVAGLEQGEHGQKEDRFGAGGDDDLLGGEVDASAAAGVVGDGLAQGRDAGGGVVAGLAVGDGAHAGHGDVGVGVKVGLADLEVDDVAALGFEGLGAGEDDVGALGLEVGDAPGKGHGGPPCAGRRNGW